MISSLKQLNAFFQKNKSTTLSNAILFTSKNIKNFSTFMSPAEALKKLQNNQKVEKVETNQKDSQEGKIQTKLLDFRELAFYQSKHICGAIAVNPIFPSLSEFRKEFLERGIYSAVSLYEPFLRQVGVCCGDQLLLYESAEEISFEPELFFFALDWLGVEGVWLVEGGIEACEEGGGFSVVEHDFLEKRYLEGDFEVKAFQGRERKERLTSFEQVCQVVQNKEEVERKQGKEKLGLEEEIQGVKILDVRSQNECLEGMIPYAINIPLQDLMEQKGYIFGFKSQEQIEKQLEEKGISKNDKIIVYCEHGFRSTYCYVKLLGLGYKNVSNYFGSYAEFSEKSQASQQ